MNESHHCRLVRRRSALAVIAIALTAHTATARAADFPEGPVTIVVPFAPGGATDALGRAIGNRLAARWGKPVVIDNKPGSGGVIGANHVARSKPDGHTLLLALSNLVQGPHLYPERKLEAVLGEIEAVSRIGTSPVMWVVRADFPAKTLQELAALVKDDPAKFGSYGSYGSGSTGHILGLVFANAAGIPLKHVSYRGEAPQITDLLGGHIPMGVISSSAAKPLVDGGKIRVLATSGVQRSLLTPEVPTFGEQGYRGMELSGWFGLFAPKGTRADLVSRIARDVVEVLAEPALQQQFRAFDIALAGTTPAAFALQVKEDYEQWGRVIRETGVKGD